MESRLKFKQMINLNISPNNFTYNFTLITSHAFLSRFTSFLRAAEPNKSIESKYANTLSAKKNIGRKLTNFLTAHFQLVKHLLLNE